MQNLSSFFDEGIKIISFCPLCQAKQEKMSVNILEKNETARLIHLVCQNCQAAVLALVTISPAGLNSLGMITDLSAGEVLKFKDNGPLEADDVLSFYQSQKKNKFWLKELLNEPVGEKA
ncbi:MAG TPA: hypothetical protein PKY08_00425 [Candidatus Magasanikbacteria bacterium]|nr:hypothetical protein [Candidatus Magasanikbacteria bacterium]